MKADLEGLRAVVRQRRWLLPLLLWGAIVASLLVVAAFIGGCVIPMSQNWVRVPLKVRVP